MKQTTHIITQSLEVVENTQENREESFKLDQEFHTSEQDETHAIRLACEDPDDDGKFSVGHNDCGQSHKITDYYEVASFDTFEQAQDFAEEENERLLKEGSDESQFQTVDLPEGWEVQLRSCRGSFDKQLIEITVQGPSGEEYSRKISASRLDGELIVPTGTIAREIPELIEIAKEENEED